jgi:hypothetical protein
MLLSILRAASYLRRRFSLRRLEGYSTAAEREERHRAQNH